MADGTLSLSSGFEDATEADWLAAVGKALKGGGIEKITRQTRDGLAIKPLYRETDFDSSSDVRGAPGDAPYLRGAKDQPNAYLPWDIRQTFSHPDPAVTNTEIMRDLERGVTSINLALECSGQTGCIITNSDQLATALQGVRADIAAISLAHRGAGSGASAAGLLALWAEGLDYDHGTGHGVGVYLSVHEGPQRISRASDVKLSPGMILSNEPGYYRTGAFGIRIENLVAVTPATTPKGGEREMLVEDLDGNVLRLSATLPA